MKNDWIIANINNPDLSAADFKNVGGFTLENTELLPIDTYLKSKQILENPNFQNNGVFDKDKFTKFYNQQALKFGDFQQDSDNYEYGFWDVLQKPNSQVRNPNFTIDKVANPTHQSTGVVGINVQGDRLKSDFELAEKQNIFDFAKGVFLNESPDDSALFKNPLKFIGSLFSSPLVLAKYEQDVDEIDPLTGQMVHHKAGDNKTNANGEYYFETLGGRSLVNKQVLSVMDTLTPEDSAVNKYDFFDSDDLEKSSEGVIAKNLAAVAPLAFLGPAGTAIYGGILAGREMLKTLPMLARVGTSLFNANDYETPILNELAAYGEKFTGGTSEYSKQHTFSFENFGNLVSDVALQWAQQKAIANTLLKIKSGNNQLIDAAKGKAMAQYEKQASIALNQAYAGKIPLNQAQELTGIETVSDIKKALESGTWANSIIGQKSLELAMNETRDSFTKWQKLGQDLSLIYMSMISNTDVYDSAIEHGATQQEAAMVALGSMIGMFSVDKYLGLGEMFFDDELAAQRRQYRKLLKDHYDNDVAPIIESLGTKPTIETNVKKGLLDYFKLGKEKTSDFLKNYHSDIKDRSLGLIAKSVGEGLEEVSEEFVTDISKKLYEVAGQFGFVSQTDIGAFEQPGARYLMSLLGGAVGGAMFGGIEALKHPKTASDENSRDALLTLIRKEGSQGIIKELDRMRAEGKLGSSELSINTQTIEDEAGTKSSLFVKADKDNISQNDFNYNQIKSAIQQMDSIINANQLNISDDKLFERMITSDIRMSGLKDYLKDASYISGYYQDYQKLVNDIVAIDLELADLEKSDDKTKRAEDYDSKKQELLDRKNKLLEQKEDFLNNKTQRYLKKTMFAVNPALAGLFMPVNFEQWVHKEYKIPVQFLPKDTLEEAKLKYQNWVKTRKIEDLDKAYEIYEQMSEKITPVLQEYKENDVKKWEEVRKLISENLPNFSKYDDIIQAKEINLKQELDRLGIIKSDEYDKPWKSDPSKSNKAYQLQLEENPSLFFEIVKDLEPGNWSIHFKTANKDNTGTALTEEQKARLFEAAMLVIPEGDRLSTWGELTKGGISGINRFGQMPEFKKVGTRQVKTKGTRPTNPKYITINELEDLDFENNYYFAHQTLISNSEDILNNGLKTSSPGLTGTALQISSKEGLQQYIENIKNGTQRHRGSEGFILIKVEKDKLPSSTNPYEDVSDLFSDPTIVDPEYIQNYIEIIPTTVKQEDIEIPVWIKNTGETEEEYNNRNTQLEGETSEEFEARKATRKLKLDIQYSERIIKEVQKLLESGAIIDPNTFRYIMVNFGTRIQDRVNSFKEMIGAKHPLYDTVQDILHNLSSDLSNINDVWAQIESKILEYVKERCGEKFGTDVAITKYDNSLKDINGIITFENLVQFLSTEIDDIIDPDYIDDDLGFYLFTELNNMGVSEDTINSVIDKHNLNLSPASVIIQGNYTVKTADGSITQVSSGEEISDPEILEAISKELEQELNTPLGYDIEQQNIMFEENKSIIKTSFDNSIKGLQKDPTYKILVQLKEKLQKDSPIHKLLKKVATSLGDTFGDIEETLDAIYTQFDNAPEAADFVLNDEQIKALEKAQNLIDAALAVIIGASQSDSYGSPWSFNKTINEWNKEYASELTETPEKLLEVGEDLANVSISSLSQYKAEIQLWLNRAKKNRINKVKMFEEFDTKFENIKLKFFMDNRDKWITEDGDNLLDGAKIVSNPKDQVLEFERALYKNAARLLKEGKNASYIFEAFKDSINWEQASTQKTSKLDLNLVQFTDYDKFVYLVSCIAYNPDNFYSDYIKFVEANKSKIAPLSFQKHTIRILKAQDNNPKIINDFLEEFKKETKSEDQPIFKNTVILTGIGGAGKSSVCAKAVIDGNTWVCGPTETQINNLKEISTDIKKWFTVSELLKLILGTQYNDNKIDSKLVTLNEKNSKGQYDGGRADVSKVDISKKIKELPKNIVLDEATLISNAELQVLANWCSLNNVKLILIGDENQNSDQNPGANIRRETTIALRTPKMQLSLRDANIWKYGNQQTLMNLEDKLRETDTADETEVVAIALNNNDLPKFGLKYYFQNGILSGDMLTSVITDEQIQSLNGTVKFIGSESSEAFKKLQAAGKVTKAYSIEEIQGQEAEYIVCDINWKVDNPNEADQLLAFMQNLYTVITRSKKGSVIIDNGLTGLIKGAEPQSYSTDSIILNDDSISKFSEKELQWLNELTLNPEELSSQKKVPAKLSEDKEIPVVLPDEEKDNTIERDSENKEIERKILPKNIDQYPLQVYTNFTYLGINRDASSKVWSNEDDSYRDIGIFLRNGETASTDKEKENLSNKLYDLKSFFLHGLDSYDINASRDLKSRFTVDDLKQATYYVVKETSDTQKHHLIVQGQGLRDLPEGETLYTLQTRFKDKNGNNCIITLGTLPKSTNLHPEISIDAIDYQIKQLEKESGNESKIEELKQIKINLESGETQKQYQKDLDSITDEREIEKPDFTGITGLAKVREYDEESGKYIYFKIRLEQVDSNKSRYQARTKESVTSPVYVCVDKNGDPAAGKAVIFTTSDRTFSPTQLVDEYERSNGKIRRIILDNAGVSFESLFDKKYIESFSPYEGYTFPFDSLPTGIRMYTALHNFRARLRKLDVLIKEKFSDLIALEKILREEARLYEEFINANKNGSIINYKKWIESQELQNDVTLDQIKEVWEFNEVTLKDLPQFRIGYNERNGVYVRKIKEDVIGNYINPQVAETYLGTIEKIFSEVLDKIIPPDSINSNDLIDYKVTEDQYKDIEDNWVKNIEEKHELLFNIIEEDKVVPITVKHKDKLKAIPLMLTLITKNLQNRQRMSNPTESFEGYDIKDSECKYTVSLGNEPLTYLEILKGGLGEIDSSGTEPGITENGDVRLLNMFNIAFHGTIATGTNDFVKSVGNFHADEVLFGQGIFVDPLLSGKYKENSKYRPAANSSKYFLTDYAPSGAKTFISLKPKEAVITQNQEDLIDEENLTLETLLDTNLLKALLKIQKRSTLERMLQNISMYSSDPIDISTQIISTLNDKFSTHLKQIFSASNGIADINTFMNVPVLIEGNNIKYIKDIILEGEKVKSLQQDADSGESYLIETESGKFFDVIYNGNIKAVQHIAKESVLKLNIGDILEDENNQQLKLIDIKDNGRALYIFENIKTHAKSTKNAKEIDDLLGSKYVLIKESDNEKSFERTVADIVTILDLPLEHPDIQIVLEDTSIYTSIEDLQSAFQEHLNNFEDLQLKNTIEEQILNLNLWELIKNNEC